MSGVEPLPYDRDAQRRTALHRDRTLAHRAAPPALRSTIRDSWERCLATGISPSLPRAPLAADDEALDARRRRSDWLGFARRAIDRLPGGFGPGHILTLFDADGCMLSGEGDPRALEGLADLNFRPGGLWTEAAVGTNGPGTALATGRAVHVLGAEHFCATWHPWHCAAVPVRDQVTLQVQGVLDVSGFRDGAHPHTLDLAIALGIAIEQMLTARDTERRFRVVQRFTELALRWPGDAVVAIDRGGAILGATPSVPDGLHPQRPAGARLRAALTRLVAAATTSVAQPATLVLHEDVGLPLELHAVFDGPVVIGACLVLDGASRRAPPRATPLQAHHAKGHGATPRAGGATRYSFLDLAGDSAPLAEACRVAAAAAANTLPVLLVGESGTGKELFAQAIHGASARRDRPFVAVNCAALPRELVESELFGYVGGAFSGARREGAVGKFELADGGTIFLDEIGELTTAAQATLLRVLQEGEVQRVGGGGPRAVDVRVVAATNRDVAASLDAGLMRQDLYYRLAVLTIDLPPLRDRREDIACLAARFLDGAERDLGRPGHAFGPGVLDAFRGYRWPGNVRELKNLVRRLVALVPARPITLADLPAAIVAGGPMPGRGPAPRPEAADAAAPDLERERTLRAIRTARTMREAALELAITRSTLYRRLERYGLRPGRTAE